MQIDKETGEIVHFDQTKPMFVPFVRTPYNYDMDAASEQTGLRCPEPTKAQQQFKDECDINTIVERFGITGQLPEDGVKMPHYGDYTNVPDYQTALNILNEAQESFMELPAKMRARFSNDPQEFLEFCSNTENRDEAIRMGLIPKRDVNLTPPVTMGVPPIPPTAVTKGGSATEPGHSSGEASKASKD